MKIVIENPRKIIESAFIKEAASSLSAIININRNLLPASFGYNCEAEGSFEVVYDDQEAWDDGDTRVDRAIFVPETEAEKKWLSCMHFEQKCKKQLWIIFLPESVYQWSREESAG